MTTRALTTLLRDEPGVVERYIQLHREIPSELVELMRSDGYRSMDIYLHERQLFLVYDRESNDAVSREPTKIELEWAATMATLQRSPDGRAQAETWVPLDVIFRLEDHP